VVKKTSLATSETEPQAQPTQIGYVFKPKEVLLNQKRFGDYWFQDCIDLGQRRLSHTFLPNLAFVHDNLELLVNYPALTLRDGKKAHRTWLKDLGQRRQRIHTHFGQRSRLIQKARQRFAALSEKRTVLVHPIAALTSLDKVKQWIQTQRGLPIVLTTPLDQEVRLCPKVLGRALPEDKDTQSQSLARVTTRSERGNLLQQWLLQKAQQLQITWVLPWAPLSPVQCQVLPIVLNNQEVNYDPAALTQQPITWAQFIDQYEAPLLPQYLILIGGIPFHSFGFWLHRMKMFAPLWEALKQTVEKQVGYLPNYPNTEGLLRLLIDLQNRSLFTPSVM